MDASAFGSRKNRYLGVENTVFAKNNTKVRLNNAGSPAKSTIIRFLIFFQTACPRMKTRSTKSLPKA